MGRKVHLELSSADNCAAVIGQVLAALGDSSNPDQEPR
ncbi:Uncharacterised protein [Amycolatopsis camponoti]|uniref:Uncharacterized protein n=1 Tax=Amycolatopsis camponoti TaxID=2606593 RepID=A0A6I8M0Z2_9PSEU|nr:Uncharacterised protein [Amycolatopsis camponoti]